LGLGFGVWSFGFGVWGSRFGVCAFRVEGLDLQCRAGVEFGVKGLGFGVQDLGKNLKHQVTIT